jgi:hypothetical protein
MNYSKSALLACLAVAALGASGACLAQNPGNGGTTYSGLQATTRPEEFLGKFVELERADVAANTLLANALGIGDAARPAAGAMRTLDMQASIGDVTGAAAAAGATRQAVTQALATRIAMSATDKANFINGAVALTQAAREFTALTKNIGATKQALTTAGAPARVALYAARNTPEMAAQLRAQVKAVVAFAAANEVTLSADVVDAAAAM